jgi:hypothetical protein
MTDYHGYTHQIFVRNSIYSCASEWEAYGIEDEDDNWHALARVRIEGDTVTLHFPEKIRFHDESEYQLRPVP